MSTRAPASQMGAYERPASQILDTPLPSGAVHVTMRCVGWMLVSRESSMSLIAQSSGLLTVPFEYVAVFVGLMFTAGVLYLVRRYLNEKG